MLTYVCAFERGDYNKIEKLNSLSDIKTFWNDVRKLTKNIHKDHALSRWQCLSEIRYWELQHGRQYTFKDQEEERERLWKKN